MVTCKEKYHKQLLTCAVAPEWSCWRTGPGPSKYKYEMLITEGNYVF